MKRATVATSLGVLLVAGAVVGFGLLRPRESATSEPSADERAAPVVHPPTLAVAPPNLQASGPATCSITGTVRRAGHPVAAEVEVLRTGSAPRHPTRAEQSDWVFDASVPAESSLVERARSSADGLYHLPALPTGGYVVRAVDRDGARGAVRVTFRIPETATEVVIELASGSAALSGTVTYEGGGAYRGQVYLLAMTRSGWVMDEEYQGGAASDVKAVATDERGAFEASGLVAGDYQVVVADGPLRFQTTTWVPTTKPLQISLPRPLDAVHGVVVDARTGAPIAGADVAWNRPGTATMKMVVKTDAEGRFAIPASAYGSVYVRATGYSRSEHWFRSDRPLESRIELQRTVTVRGRAAYAADGRPASGIAVEASIRNGWASVRPDARTLTGADGRYEFTGLDAGEVRVRVHCAEGVARGMSDLDQEHPSEPLSYDPLTVSVNPGETGVLDLVIEPAARIVGRVLDALGSPAARVVVEAWRPGMSFPSSTMEPSYWGNGDGVTDADGRYVIEGLVPRWGYEVSARRGAEYAHEYTTTPVGGADATMNFTFPAMQTFDVQVVDAATGKGVAGLALIARPEKPWDVAWRGSTGEDGFARVGPVRRAGIAFSVLEGREWSVVKETAEVPGPAEGQERPTWILRVSHEPTREEIMGVPVSDLIKAVESEKKAEGKNPLRVRVLDAEGRPIPRADLTWHWEDSLYGTSGSAKVSDGAALVQRPVGRPGSSTTVVVTGASAVDGSSLAFGRAESDPIPESAESVEIRLPVERAVTGRVTDTDGRGVAGVRMRWTDFASADRVSSLHAEPLVRTDPDGRFRIGGLGEGKGWVTLLVPERYAEAWPFEVDAGGAPVDFRLHSSVEAVVTIVGADAKGLAGFSITAFPDGPNRPSSMSNLVWNPRWPDGTTDAEGKARLAGLDPELKHRLWIRKEVENGPELTADVNGWTPADTVIAFRMPRVYHGFVRDPAGRPVELAHVIAFVDKDRVANAITDAAGRFTLEDKGVGPGPLWLYAGMAEWGKTSGSKSIRAPAGDEDAVLVVDPGADVIVAFEGDWAVDRQVWITSDAAAGWDGAAECAWGRTDATGVVRFRGLNPDHAYAIWAGPMWHASTEYDGLTAFVDGVKAWVATPGAPVPTVRLRLAPGGTIRARSTGLAAPHAYVHAQHGSMRVEGERLPDGTFEVRGLCDIEWTLVAESSDGLFAEAKGRPGDTVTLEFIRKAPR